MRPEPRAVPPLPDADFSDLCQAKAGDLLQLVLARSRNVAEELVLVLSGAEGGPRFGALLDHAWAGRAGAPEEKLAAGGATLDELRELKAAAKALFWKGSDRDERVAAALAYFLALAAALAHHGALITGEDREDLARVFTDLAALSPAPWPDLFVRALEALARFARR